ncbi:dipeptide epimerase [uncultured Pseudoteredinibacter sp.]|uniref:dipeptide epimerase n=1 Tax=uncultured Pseudoteredinibacter sp. TaxID=1641701 RepID=UPI002607F8A0|nr:dipeptide epimerase [uncultured Pseudoteredinibacter sp.]
MEFKYNFYKRKLRQPLEISDYLFEQIETLEVTLYADGQCGRGEAAGVYYLNDDRSQMESQLIEIKQAIEAGIDTQSLQQLLAPGGARNAIDCALWDLNCKREGISIWQKLKLSPKNLHTVFTIGLNEAEIMAKQAVNASGFKRLKLKLNNQQVIEKLSAVHRARPDAEIILDINQGWSEGELIDFLPQLKSYGVILLEQPLARGGDEILKALDRDIAIAADESCLDMKDYHHVKQRYDVINIKLDKCGGFSEALNLVKQAKSDGKQLMVGNMIGSSLAMAPAYVIGQYCQFIDIDGPLLLESDCPNALRFHKNGLCEAPSLELWG